MMTTLLWKRTSSGVQRIKHCLILIYFVIKGSKDFSIRNFLLVTGKMRYFSVTKEELVDFVADIKRIAIHSDERCQKLF